MSANYLLPIKIGVIGRAWILLCLLHLLSLGPIADARILPAFTVEQEQRFMKNFGLMVDTLSLPQNRDLLDHIRRLNDNQAGDFMKEDDSISGRSSPKDPTVSPIVYNRILQRFNNRRDRTMSGYNPANHGLGYINNLMEEKEAGRDEASPETDTKWDFESLLQNRDLMKNPIILDYLSSYPGAGHTMLNSIDEGANLAITLLPMHRKGYYPYGNTMLNEGGRGVNGALLHVASNKTDTTWRNIIESLGSLDFEIDLKKLLGDNETKTEA